MITPRAVQDIAALGLNEEQVFGSIDPGLLLALSDVSPNTYNPKQCNDKRIMMIASSLRESGWVPSELPLVWEDPDGTTRYTIINGEHRWYICKAAGFKQYPAIVTTAVKTREDAMAVTMALEDARARPDRDKHIANLMDLARSGRDDLLKNVLGQRDPEELRRLSQQRAEAGKRVVEEARARKASAPRLVSLTFTGAQYDEYAKALGKARTRLKRAQETIDMLKELSDADVAAIAAVIRNGR